MFSYNSIYAQNYVYSTTNSINVSIAGVGLANPFTGGINNAQAYKLELDGQSGEDLILFDKYTNRVFTYIFNGNEYIYSPKFEYLLPTVTNWLTIIDYNGDGKKDIFTSAGDESFVSFVKVYKNISTTNSITGFEKVTSKLEATTRIGSTEIYVSNSEIPAVLDLDNDTDIDIVVYDASGGASSLSFYRNRSIEDGTVLGLNFEKYTSCWGKFSIGSNCNNLTTTITNCKGFSGTTDALRMMHNGSSVAIVDLNGDGIKDVLLGDTSCPYLYLITNSGTNLDAISDATETNYPPSNPVTVTSQPMVSMVDLDNDNKVDMIVSGVSAPFETNFANKTSTLQYFRNISNTTIPAFGAGTTDFFANNSSIDFGFDSYPDFFDMDADGDMDIMVGYRETNASSNAVGLKLFENIGNATVPAFNLIDTDYLGLSTLLGLTMIKPRFADINNDGAIDLYFLCRETSNAYNIRYVLNSASASQPVLFVPRDVVRLNTTTISFGENSNIFLYDLNDDNLLDLLVCKSDQGVLNYYHNSGTTSIPKFERANNTLGNMIYDQNRFGNIITIGKLTSNSATTSLLWVDNRGKIFIYPNFMNEKTNFITIDSISIAEQIGKKHLGANTVPTLADLNADGKTDILLGGRGGGLRIFMNNYSKPTSTIPSPIIIPEPTVTSNIVGTNNKNQIQIYPNPTQGAIYWNNYEEDFNQIEIMDMQGVWKEKSVLLPEHNHSYYTQNLTNGIYIIKLSTPKSTYYTKVHFIKK